MPTWIQPFTPNPDAKAKLFCFSYSGGSTRIFRPFLPLLSPDIEIGAVRLPGRETRLGERPLKSVEAVLEGLLPELVAQIDRPFALLGHSLGALLAYETTRALRDRGHPLPSHLFLSARGAPDSPARSTPIYDLPEPALIQAIAERYRPIPEVILKEPELLALTLPALRGDLEILARHRYVAAPPLEIPITIFGGSRDRVVPREDLDRWASHGHRVDVEVFDGDHFFIEDPTIISRMAATIRSKLRG